MKYRLTAAEVAKAMSLGIARIYQAANNGDVGKKFGVAWLFCDSDIERLRELKGRVGPRVVK